MLILRQHNYTFGEQKAIEQFMKLTHNGRAIPRGYKNLTAKDIVKLKDVAKTIDEKGIKSLDPKTAKYYLNKLGFTETADNYERLVDKYNNPELIERFKRRKLRENPDQNYIPDQFTERNKILRKSVKKDNIAIIKDATKRPVIDKKLVEEQKKQLQKGPKPIRFITTSNPHCYNNAAANSQHQLIVTPKKFKHGKRKAYDPFIISHEVGHLDGFFSKFPNNKNYRGSFTQLVNELGASAHSIAKVTPKVSKKMARRGRKHLEHVGNAYWSSFIEKKNRELGKHLSI